MKFWNDMSDAIGNLANRYIMIGNPVSGLPEKTILSTILNIVTGGSTKTLQEVDKEKSKITPEYLIQKPTEIAITWINGSYYNTSGQIISDVNWKRCEPFAIPTGTAYVTNYGVVNNVVASILFYNGSTLIGVLSTSSFLNNHRLVYPSGTTHIAFSSVLDSKTIDSLGNKVIPFKLVTGQTTSMSNIFGIINDELFIIRTLIPLTDTIVGKHINTNGVVTKLSSIYNLKVYSVTSGNKIKIKGITRGEICAYAFYSDEQLTELVSKSTPNIGVTTFNVNDDVIVPTGAIRLAVTRQTEVGDINAFTIDPYTNNTRIDTLESQIRDINNENENNSIADIVVTSYGDSITQQNTIAPYLKQLFKFNTMYNRGIGSTRVCAHLVGDRDLAFVDLGQHDGKPGYIVGVQNSLSPNYRPTTGTEGVNWIEIKQSLCTQSRIDTIPDNTNLLLIMCMTNDMVDLSNGLSLGTINDTYSEDDSVVDTVYASFKKLVVRAMNRLPNAKIVIIAPMYCELAKINFEAIYNVAKDVAMLYNLPFIGLRDIGINTLNWATYTPDKVHPNDAGSKKVANSIGKEIDSMFLIR